MKNVISFCLYSSKTTYTLGMKENILLGQKFFPDWEIRIYYNDIIPDTFINEYIKLGAICIKCENKMNLQCILWRFFPLDDESVHHWISRDVDSRLSKRDANLVNQWIQSNKTLHCIRDHKYHCNAIMGGMFGINNKFFHAKYKFKKIVEIISELYKKNIYNVEQDFLNNNLWNVLKHDVMCHISNGGIRIYSSDIEIPAVPDFIGMKYILQEPIITKDYKMGKKVISYCLFGNKLKYCHGIIEAVISSNIIFLDWEVRVYYSIGKQAVPKSVIKILKNLNCKLIAFSESNKCKGEDIEGMMWRFCPLGEDDVECWLSRDADSRSSFREKIMVDEWLNSDKAIHSILDHPCHGNLMGCNFGINNKKIKERYPDKIINMNEFIPHLAKRKDIRRGYDQNWISNHFMDIMKKQKDILVHLNKREDCIKKCHIGGIRPVTEHFDTILVENTKYFCGKQNNYSNSKLSRPVVEIESLQLNGTI